MTNTFLAKSLIIFLLGTTIAAHAMEEELENNDGAFSKTPTVCIISRPSVVEWRNDFSGNLTIERDDNSLTLSDFKIKEGSSYHKQLMEYINDPKSPEAKLAHFMLEEMPHQSYSLSAQKDGLYGANLEEVFKDKKGLNSRDAQIYISKADAESYFRLNLRDPRIKGTRTPVSTGATQISVCFKIPPKGN